MLQGEHSAVLSTFIKLPFVIKIFLSIFEWPFYTGFTLSVFLTKEDQASTTGGRIYLPKYVMVFLFCFFVSVDAYALSSQQFSVLSGSFPGLNQY